MAPRQGICANKRQEAQGIKIGIAEHFPEEIEKVRKTLYPELRKAKSVMVRDKLYIEGQVFCFFFIMLATALDLET